MTALVNALITLVATVTKYLVPMMTVIKSVDALVSVNVRQSKILANVEYDRPRNTGGTNYDKVFCKRHLDSLKTI